MSQVCRTCLEETPDSNCIPLNNTSLEIKEQLRTCLPEVDVELVPDAFMCIYCVNELQNCFAFKQKCLLTEKQIRSQLHTEAVIDLAELKKASEEDVFNGNEFESVGIIESNLGDFIPEVENDDVQMEVNGDADETVDFISIDDEDDEDDTDSYNMVLGLCESAPRKHPPTPQHTMNVKISTNSISYTNSKESPNTSKKNTTNYIQDKSPPTNNNIRARRSSTSTFSCSICSATMTEVFDYIAHTKMAHKGVAQYYKCCKCLFTTKAPTTLMKHFEGHRQSVSNTEATVLITDSDVSIAEQRMSAISPKTSTTNRRAPYTNTGNASPSSNLHKCRHCIFVAPDAKTLNIHMDSHIFKCNKCYYIGTTHDAYKKHLTTHSLTLESDDVVVIEDDEDIPCSKCNYIAKGAMQLENHTFVAHSGKSRYICKTCGYTTTAKTSLVKHSKFHEGCRQYHCSICSYNCDLEYNLTKHLTLRHHGRK